MTAKIDLFGILSDHIATLKRADNDKISKWDLVFFYVIPLVIGASFSYFVKSGFDSTSVGIWIGALSILAGLLINVLVLLYTVKEVGPTEVETTEQKNLIKEVNANILYEIVIAVIAIVALCVVPALNDWPERLLSGIVIAIAVNFTLTLLMTLKRLRVLVGLRFKPGAKAA